MVSLESDGMDGEGQSWEGVQLLVSPHLSKVLPLHGGVHLPVFRLFSCALMLKEAGKYFWQLLGALVLSPSRGGWQGAGQMLEALAVELYCVGQEVFQQSSGLCLGSPFSRHCAGVPRRLCSCSDILSAGAGHHLLPTHSICPHNSWN